MRQCAICGKKRKLGWELRKLRGKYNPTKKKRQYPNLQWVRLASGKRVLACAKCIKAMGKKK
jgi:ribosomal protein L28